jgi:hypothetical protein
VTVSYVSRYEALPAGHALPAGWQAYALFALLPVWWLFGLAMFIWPLLVLPLVFALARRGGVRLPRRYGLWLLFVAWTLVTALEVHGGDRIAAYVWRESFYLAVTVLFVYVVSMPERLLPTRSLVNALATYWLFVTLGGYLGVFFPHFSAASPLEHVLPGAILRNPYVFEHVHLHTSEVQHFLGFAHGRPSTFFAYTNAWGSAFAMLTPFAIAAAMRARHPLWRYGLRAALLLAVVPAIWSLDRGLWLSLGVGLIYATLRFAQRGHARLLGGILASLAIAGMLVFATPLSGLVSARFSHKTGDKSRLERNRAAVQESRQSPILGYGTPLKTNEAGKTVGTESEVFLLLFSHGVPGLFLFTSWFAYTLFRSGRFTRPEAFWPHVALLVGCVQTPYYEVTERLPIMIVAAALLYREIDRGPEPEPARAVPQERGWERSLAPAGMREAWR